MRFPEMLQTDWGLDMQTETGVHAGRQTDADRPDRQTDGQTNKQGWKHNLYRSAKVIMSSNPGCKVIVLVYCNESCPYWAHYCRGIHVWTTESKYIPSQQM